MEKYFGYGQEVADKYGEFELMSGYHIISLIILIALYIVVPLIMKNKSDKAKKIFRYSLAVFMIIEYLIFILWFNINTGWVGWKFRLPLHLCAAANILCIITLFTKKQIIFEVSYFWGIGGGLMSILTPDTIHAFPHFEFIQTMIHHGFLILVAVYMVVAEGFKITLKSFLRVAVITNVYLGLIMLFNLIAGTNYLYINKLPDFYTFATELEKIFGPWPLYLIGYEIVGWIIFTLAYLPHHIKKIVNNRRNLSSETQ